MNPDQTALQKAVVAILVQDASHSEKVAEPDSSLHSLCPQATSILLRSDDQMQSKLHPVLQQLEQITFDACGPCSSTMAVGASLRLLAALILTLPGFAQSFMPNSFFSWTLSHRDITQIAILRKTAEVCRDVAAAEGRSFTLEITDTLSVNKVQTACSVPLPGFPVSSEMLQAAINSVHDSSDALRSPDPAFHFHSEAFLTGRDLITQGLSSLKASVKEQNFQAARNTLGRICHTLQDFYSHSNWVELGRTAAYSALIRPDQPLENLAGPDVPTCKSCAGLSCKDNILPAVLEQGLLTSGYYSTESPAKPAGKCSHGGVYDQTSRTEPTGGINKDTNSSSHGQLHRTAADLAVDATVDLLEDIRVAIGDRTFLRLMDISQAPALVFVVDTTGSMGDDITYVQTVTATIINERRGTPMEPFEYILVPFNDTEFGPVMRTTDADEMMTKINSLTPSGGADGLKMSLSGLRLALTAAPPSSFIVLFTDAEAKDASLKNAVTALIETTKSKVFPILTYFNARRRKRTVTVGSSERLDLDLDLAQASGGLAIEISKSQISAATPIIEQFSVGAVVTVLHAAVDPGTPRNLTFLVDTTLSYMQIYITGDSSLTFTLTSSTGVSQSSSESSGSLASISTAGNLWVLRLNPENQAGQWAIALNATTAYTVKVTGRSSLNFVYNLVEPQEGTNGSVIPKEGRPSTGDKVTLWVTVTGSDTATVRDVSLFDFSRSTQLSGSVQSIGNGDYLVAFSEVPAGSFLLQLTGQETNSTSAPTSFQRQASTQITTSSLSVTAQADSLSIEPGSSVSVSFTVTSEETGTFTIQANNDRDFGTAWSTSVSIGTGDGGQANGTVTLATPADAASGTDVSLTIVAENADGTEINYVVLRFSIATKVTDLSAPVCQHLCFYTNAYRREHGSSPTNG
ncbi:von Willebrand factor A domain-containing protein 7-like [Xiphophorus maculatus]|uniref:von Willebrand factor A domain-containing protein 7-like n=1 Tax=Xiphophorus maculatus TaxID=8083 RepID=UPI000C6DA923|nr:von Willebrand factor A domain-containing protein 7-like [Xiphophorus maculatus]